MPKSRLIDLKKHSTRIITNYYVKKCNFLVSAEWHKWLNSYLENRKQFTGMSIDKCQSAVCNISCGVPQGSILAPKLFILYINDMCNISKLVKYILFADDMTNFYADNNIRRLSYTVCSVLDKMSTWFAVNM